MPLTKAENINNIFKKAYYLNWNNRAWTSPSKTGSKQPTSARISSSVVTVTFSRRNELCNHLKIITLVHLHFRLLFITHAAFVRQITNKTFSIICSRWIPVVQTVVPGVVRQLFGADGRGRGRSAGPVPGAAAVDGAEVAEDLGAAPPAPSQLRQPLVRRQQLHRQLRHGRPLWQLLRYDS